MELALSKSPAKQGRITKRWFKPIIQANSTNGKIVMNVFGDTKEEAEQLAVQILNQLNGSITK